MKKQITACAALGVTLCLAAGCSSKPEETAAPETAAAEEETAAEAEEEKEPVEVIVFAAASMTETLTEIGNAYMEENPEVTLIFNFDSSGTLKTQIQEGADCDIFISAGQKQMNQLDINANPEQLKQPCSPEYQIWCLPERSQDLRCLLPDLR